MKKELAKEISSTARHLLSIACPLVDIPNIINDGAFNLSNIILTDKIKRFLSKQDDDFEDKLKLSSKFNENDKHYNRIVKVLIQTINSINDDQKIDVYANLTRSWLHELIDENTYMRLAFILGSLYCGDLIFLKENHDRTINEVYDVSEGYEILSIFHPCLVNYGLIHCSNIDVWKDSGDYDNTYKITRLGLEMVRCGVDFDNYCSYKDIDRI